MHVQDDLNLYILRMFEDTFCLMWPKYYLFCKLIYNAQS